MTDKNELKQEDLDKVNGGIKIVNSISDFTNGIIVSKEYSSSTNDINYEELPEDE